MRRPRFSRLGCVPVDVPDLAILSLTAAAAGTDLRWGRIPNGLTAPFAVAGLLFHVFTGGPSEGLVTSIAGLALGLLLPGVMFALGGMGGGDVKLLASIGAWAGPHRMLSILLYSALAGGVAGLLVTMGAGKLRDVRRIGTDVMLLILSRARVEPARNAMTFPYSLPIALGVVLNVVFGELW